jgi:diguanylate cyclase (GGDEF)-like protein
MKRGPAPALPSSQPDVPDVPRARGARAPAPRKAARRPALEPSKRDEWANWLAHLAQVDFLTELPHRTRFTDRLGEALARARRSGELVGVVLLNIDHFRALNTRCGHAIGDAALKEAASRLKQQTRKSDFVARVGGDEFAVLLEGVGSNDVALVAAQRLMEALAEPLQIGGQDIAMISSAGVAFFPADGDSVEMLLQNADIALCNAREYHRNTCQVYSSALRAQTRHREERRKKIVERLETLTPREREVNKILIAGNANKMIAYMLGTSTRTIETHRASIMEKMDARSLPDLVRMVMEVGGAAEEQQPHEPAEPGSEASGRSAGDPARRS